MKKMTHWCQCSWIKKKLTTKSGTITSKNALQKRNILETFITTVQSPYADAHTQILHQRTDRKKVMTTLFADDTTVYLSHMDDIGYLTCMLDEWSKASGAKLNVEKSIILVLSAPEYRQ